MTLKKQTKINKNLPKISKNKLPKKVRIDLNLEKYPLFAPSNFKGHSREYKRIEIKNNIKYERIITIGKNKQKRETGVLKIFDYKVFCALLKLWENKGKPMDGNINFAVNEIIKTLKLPRNGRTHGQIKKSLFNLATIPIIWKDSYYDKKLGDYVSGETAFYMLRFLEVFEKSNNPKQDHFSFSRCKLHEKIMTNIALKHSKPILLDEINKLKKDISLLLYRIIDLFLSSTSSNSFSRMSEKIFEDLDLTKYKFRSKRKQLLEPALKELVGMEMSSCVFSGYEFVETDEKKDWKVKFYKAPIPKAVDYDLTNSGEQKLSEPSLKDKEVEFLQDYFNQKFNQNIEYELIQSFINIYSYDKVFQNIRRIDKNTAKNPVGYLVSSLKNDMDLPASKEEKEEENKKILEEKQNREKELEMLKEQSIEQEELLKEELMDYFNNLDTEDQDEVRRQQQKLAKKLFGTPRIAKMSASQEIALLNAIEEFKQKKEVIDV